MCCSIAGGGQATVATLALVALRWIPAATEASFLFYTFPAWVAVILTADSRYRAPRSVTRVVAPRWPWPWAVSASWWVRTRRGHAAIRTGVGAVLTRGHGRVRAVHPGAWARCQRQRARDRRVAGHRGGRVPCCSCTCGHAASGAPCSACFDAAGLAASACCRACCRPSRFWRFLAGLSGAGPRPHGDYLHRGAVLDHDAGARALLQPVGSASARYLDRWRRRSWGRSCCLQRPPVASAPRYNRRQRTRVSTRITFIPEWRSAHGKNSGDRSRGLHRLSYQRPVCWPVAMKW